jgi:hypothetical protein
MNKKRIMLEVSEESHAILKVYAALRKMTMKEVVEEYANQLRDKLKSEGVNIDTLTRNEKA